MIKKTLIALLSLGIVLAAVAIVLYASNPAPTVREISPAEIAEPGKPYVVKFHARWCPACMLTKSVWSQIRDTYTSSVHFVVFDITSQEATETSRAEASRLGLDKVFEQYEGSPGTIAVLDGRTKEVTASFVGDRDFAAYIPAIDAVLEETNP